MPCMNLSSLGERITYYRKKAGISQKDLAIAAGMAPNSISNYEKDKRMPSIVVLQDLAKALNVTADTLLGLESPENTGESNVLRAYRSLNSLGQDRVVELLAWLEETPKYINNSSLLA